MNPFLPRPVMRLIEAFARLPGIGPKTSARLTYFLLRAPEEESRELAGAIAALRSGTAYCSICFNITEAGVDPCAICSDPDRDPATVCVVEDMLDVAALERTGRFHGRYHVLHGALSPVEGIGPEDLRIEELVTRLEREPVREIILATNPTMEGEATAMFLRQRLQGLGVKLTRLARGLPSGGDLEYADVTTLTRALEDRSEM